MKKGHDFKILPSFLRFSLTVLFFFQKSHLQLNANFLVEIAINTSKVICGSLYLFYFFRNLRERKKEKEIEKATKAETEKGRQTKTEKGN